MLKRALHAHSPLGPGQALLQAAFDRAGDTAMVWQAPLDPWPADLATPDFLVSYGYRHILRAGVLARFPRRAINLHISWLPWNRGSDPNLWSVLEGTPSGVTIHEIDVGLDTGPILVQRHVPRQAGDTLRTSYDRLSRTIEDLFFESWPALRVGAIPARVQPPGGSHHRVRDRARVEHLLTAGWDTPTDALAQAYARAPTI